MRIWILACDFGNELQLKRILGEFRMNVLLNGQLVSLIIHLQFKPKPTKFCIFLIRALERLNGVRLYGWRISVSLAKHKVGATKSNDKVTDTAPLVAPNEVFVVNVVNDSAEDTVGPCFEANKRVLNNNKAMEDVSAIDLIKESGPFVDVGLSTKEVGEVMSKKQVSWLSWSNRTRPLGNLMAEKRKRDVTLRKMKAKIQEDLDAKLKPARSRILT
ncbi:hypothetical protein V6N12_062876 [Hibiscus sabdariffa]|uniref:Uncharacterized protein n=1 Tax=Hibiscus sabdariffa TaxID=183260 RepID=A0ABR2FA35_9ROSI